MIRAFLLFAAALVASAQSNQWRTPFPGHRIIGNLYYVGTYDLACFYLVTPAGNVLINTGDDASFPLIKTSVESLGFKLQDTKILLTTQAHNDHVGAMAQMKAFTHAKMMATDGDAGLLEDGGKSDYVFFPGSEHHFAPVHVDARLKDRQKIAIGGAEITVYLHAGHTLGSSSYGMTIDGKRVLIANMGTINPGTVLIGNPRFPKANDAYAATFADQKKLSCDIFLSSHAGQYGLHEKWKPGQAYDPETFVDPNGYKTAVVETEADYLKYLAKEKQSGK